MRICHIVEATAGGSARVVAQLIRGQVARGNEVTLIYSPIRADAPFLAAIQAIPSLRCIALPMRRSVGLHDVKALMRLTGWLWREGPFDILHSHCSKAGGLARLAGLLWPCTAKIHSPHGFVTMGPDGSRLYAALEKILSVITDAIITVSPYEKRHAVEDLGLAEVKLHTILNGVELDLPQDRAAARRRIGWEDEAFVIGFVGRLVEVKNPFRLIETFRSATARRPDARLAVVGEGPLRQAMEERLQTYGLTERAQFLGAIDAHDVMAGFDVLLCTSDSESFGIVMVEALAAGVPVVTTPVGIAASAVREGETGFIRDFTPESLAAPLRELEVGDPARAAHCRQQAQKFSISAMVEATAELYAKVARRSAKQRAAQ